MSITVRKIFDKRICNKIENMNILLIGVGGIGSEFLKNLITIGCKNIDILDIDTIDITNLNRQFLYKREDVKKYKSIVAKEKALRYKADLNINAFTHDVCTMKVDDIKKYDYIINALDNIKARTYVNKLCIAANKVLIESGSTGYNGQVYPILYNETKCYNCEEKAKVKTFAVCTIRQTPKLPEHCVAWGKLIYEMFFCKSENEILSDIKKNVEDTLKVKKMSKEEIIIFIFDYLFYDSINELIKMKTDFFVTPNPIKYEHYIKENKDDNIDLKNKTKNLNNNNNNNENLNNNKIELCSQQIWNINKCIEMYMSTFIKLYDYLNINKKNNEFLEFDKDDEDCMNFITAISNLRMINFHIEQKSKFDIESISGNIIPAIASTNAMVAAMQICQLFHVIEYFEILKKQNEEMNLRNSKARHVWIRNVISGNEIFKRGNLITSENLEKPNPNCYICQQSIINVHIKNLDDINLYTFVKEICINELTCLYPFLDTEDRNIFDYELFIEGDKGYIKSLYRSLSEWKIKDGEIFTLTDIQNSNDQIEIHLKVNSLQEELYLIKRKEMKKRPLTSIKYDQKEKSSKRIKTEETKKIENINTKKIKIIENENEIIIDEDEDEEKNDNKINEDKKLKNKNKKNNENKNNIIIID